MPKPVKLKKYMYVARVLVGEYSQGYKGSVTPAAKSAGNTVDLYDSSTDNPFKLAHFILAEVRTLTALQKTGKTLPITGCAMTQQLLTGKHSFSRPKYGTLKKITPAIAMRGRLWH
ncbi:hypothetical protein Anapl_00937 [Anas platyrhynchos]|uniref:Uncharacterized protein n=1 Tax=Anas platyrhynchos TaxID=8839 RepID=R0LQY9_ANAPL|nr:hypothetical protein Anapl_00937 [Anas platyrhynchos]